MEAPFQQVLLFIATAQHADSGYGRHAEEQDQEVIGRRGATVQPLLLPPSSLQIPLSGSSPVVVSDIGALIMPDGVVGIEHTVVVTNYKESEICLVLFQRISRSQRC